MTIFPDDIGQSGKSTYFCGKKIYISSSLGLFCKANDELPPQDSCTGQEMSKSVKGVLVCFHLQGKKDIPISINLCLLFWLNYFLFKIASYHPSKTPSTAQFR